MDKPPKYKASDYVPYKGKSRTPGFTEMNHVEKPNKGKKVFLHSVVLIGSMTCFGMTARTSLHVESIQVGKYIYGAGRIESEYFVYICKHYALAILWLAPPTIYTLLKLRK